MDQLSVKRIALLHPWVREDALKILEAIGKVLTGRASVRFTYTLRTWTEQNALYALGRTVVNPDGKEKDKPLGNIVTWAKAGSSFHNFGLAIDIALIIDGKTASWDSRKDWDGDLISDWQECVKIFKAHGWEWGGDWKNKKDEPHFQKDFGYSWQDLKKMYEAGKFMPGTSYVVLERKVYENPKIFRTTTGVNLREGQGTDHNVMKTLLKGTIVREIGRFDNGWSKVEAVSEGLVGFLSNQYLTK